MTRSRRRLAKIKKWMYEEFPGEYPIRLVVSRMPLHYRDCLGIYCPPDKTKYASIWICKTIGLSRQIETLIHEWAHYRVDPNGLRSEDKSGGHSNNFYLEYGRIERAYQKALEDVLRVKNVKR